MKKLIKLIKLINLTYKLQFGISGVDAELREKEHSFNLISKLGFSNKYVSPSSLTPEQNALESLDICS